MIKSQVHFFSTRDELVAILGAVASIRSFDLYKAGLFDSSVNQKMDDFSEIENFTNYLVIDSGMKIHSKEVNQRVGSIKHAFDQSLNPKVAVLNFGGLYNESHLIASQFGTATGTPEALAWVELFRNTLKKSMLRIKSYYVSQRATEMLDGGARLSATAKGALEYDLAR